MTRRRYRRETGGDNVSIVWEGELWGKIDGLAPAFHAAMLATLRYYEPRIENYARQNAPWTDQTANARNGLIARSGSTGSQYFLVLAHRVPYGIYLETRWSGKYAIIMPTINSEGPKVMGTIEKIFERIGAEL